MLKCIKICDDVRLSYKLEATGIYIYEDGSITITATNIPIGTKIPRLTVEWLETTCLRTTYRECGQAFGISDVMAREGLITFAQTNELYENIEKHLSDITLITI